MATINVSCRFCNKTHAVKNTEWEKLVISAISVMTVVVHFINNEYKAWQTGIKDTICDMAMNGSGIRDTHKSLKN